VALVSVVAGDVEEAHSLALRKLALRILRVLVDAEGVWRLRGRQTAEGLRTAAQGVAAHERHTGAGVRWSSNKRTIAQLSGLSAAVGCAFMTAPRSAP
jgi:hypothetical protein